MPKKQNIKDLNKEKEVVEKMFSDQKKKLEDYSNDIKQKEAKINFVEKENKTLNQKKI